MTDTHKGAALITGASTGIGAVYADRLAKRGYDLILVARDVARLEALAAKLRVHGVKVDVLPADLTARADLLKVEQRLRDDQAITLLVNNAGLAGGGGFAAPDIDKIEALIQLNVTAVTRLAAAAAPGFVARGIGAIINLSSVVAYAPELFAGVYSATKAYVFNLSRSLQLELGPKGVYVQVVAPSATATEIWDRSGMPISNLPAGSVMPVDDLVDAALVGFDRREAITLPSLPGEGQWQTLEAARLAMAQNFRNEKPAARYRSSEPVT
jgi:short-subunit dehydrogenase